MQTHLSLVRTFPLAFRVNHLVVSTTQLSLRKPGLVTYSIIFCLIFTIKDQGKKVCFYKHTIKVSVSCSWWCPRTSSSSAPHLTVSFYLCRSGSNTRLSQGPLKGAVSAQRALQGSEKDVRELLLGRKENYFLPDEGSLMEPSRQINYVLLKENRRKMS